MIRYSTFCLLLTLLWACGGHEPAESTITPAPDRASAPAAAPASAPATALPSYLTQTVSKQTVNRPVPISGRVVPLQEATVASQVPGIILPTDKLLQEGKYYRKGETMVKIDDEQLRLGLRAERSKLITALVPLLSDISLDYANEHPAWERFVNQIKANESLPAMPAMTNEQLRYFINSRGIPAQYYGIKAREALLDDYTVTAPFSGKLTMAAAEPGSYVAPGAPLAKIARTDLYEVRAQIPAVTIDQVATGQKVKLFARNLGQEFTGTVHRFGAAIDPATQTVPTFIRVSGKALRTGLYLEAELPGNALTDIVVLPKEALTRDQQVYVINDGIIGTKAVEVALVDADKVYLHGLDNGDRVITEAVNKAIVGSKATSSK